MKGVGTGERGLCNECLVVHGKQQLELCKDCRFGKFITYRGDKSGRSGVTKYDVFAKHRNVAWHRDDQALENGKGQKTPFYSPEGHWIRHIQKVALPDKGNSVQFEFSGGT